jgi:hypothetical protein
LVRIVSTALIVSPIGYFMGIPMPVGMHPVRERRGVVFWHWASNSALSAFASGSGIDLAIEAGVSVAFDCGALGYFLAALLRERARPQPTSPKGIRDSRRASGRGSDATVQGS